MQLFALHIYVVLFLVHLSPFLHTAAEASFDIKRLVGSRTLTIFAWQWKDPELDPYTCGIQIREAPDILIRMRIRIRNTGLK